MTESSQIPAIKPAGNRISAKDLINIGLFTVLYLIVVFVVAMLGYIPIFIPLLSVLVPLAAGIPYMLFLTKVKKFGMVLIQGILVGLFYSLMGMSLWALACTFVCSLLAELILRTGGYKSAKKAILSYAIVSCWVMGNFLPIFVARNAYYDMIIASNYGTAYADGLMAFMPDWILPVLLVSCFVFGILGGLLGKATMRKHFQRAGLA
jgi:energy-coupling factor transport system substrate-specific component